MKAEQPLISFLPGKGIYDLPTGKRIIETYSIEEAKQIFALHSKMLVGKYTAGHHKFLDAAIKLVEVSSVKKQNRPITDPEMINFKLDRLDYSETRTYVNRKKIGWDSVENMLKMRKFSIKQRELDGLCPIYVIKDPSGQVVAEGKGLDDETARCSALGEAIERLVGAYPKDNQIVLASCSELFASKGWKFDIETGLRDAYSPDIITEWIPCLNISRNDMGWMPAEVAFTDYSPTMTKVRLFGLHHTTGLSSGSSFEEAAINGLFEVLERDVYWIAMRCRITCPDIPLSEVNGMDKRVYKLIEKLSQRGLRVIVKDFSLDWDIPIAHATIVDSKGRIPAFAHGTGTGTNWATAIARSVCEAVQMHSGLKEISESTWHKIVEVKEVIGNPRLAWCDPLIRPHIEHLVRESDEQWNEDISVVSVKDFIESLMKKGHEVLVSRLGTAANLEVVRVHVTYTTQPDERLERIGKRLELFRKENNINSGYYHDPILT